MKRLLLVLVLVVAVSCDKGGGVDGTAGGSTQSPTITDTTSSPTGPTAGPPMTKVPSVEGLQLEKAQKLLTRATLDAEINERYSGELEGSVLRQDPEETSRVAEGTVVVLTIAKALPRIPDVVGLTVVKAQRALRRADFEARVVRSGTSGTPGTITSQTPSAGTGARPGRQVRIVTPNCTPGYSPCLPPAYDYDCAGGTGDGPKYTGFVRVTGSDTYGLDADNDGYGCE